MGLPGISFSLLSPLFNVFVHVCCLNLLNSGFFSKLGGNETDLLALLAFKAKITDDPLQVMSTWNGSFHLCEWQGVTCSRRHQRVTVLDLHSQQLAGSITPHIGNLSFLKVLDIHNNRFINEIPQQIGYLFRLESLSLENNIFGGHIPANISHCSNLIYLGLCGNKLVGEIPKDLGSLPKLQVLMVNNNYLTGGVPPSIGNLSSLNIFSATTNYLEGSIPDTLGELKNLSHLAIGANSLSGTIPLSIYNLSSITHFSVPVNRIQGSLPPNFGINLPNLHEFNIHTNQLGGLIPASIVNASNLLSLSMGNNRFIGKVPSLAIPNILEVGLDNNSLGNGEDGDLDFLSSLVNCSSLEDFVISDNNIKGVLPKSISNFSTMLRTMGLGGNQIRGSIPSEIGNLRSLEALGLETNQLTGSIPSSIGKLQKLVELCLEGNKLSGSIPSSIGNLTLLGRLNLRRNNLQGSIPTTLGECRNLLAMALSYNHLSGTIPKQVVSMSSLSIYLELNQNHLTGSLPFEVGKLTNLAYLDVSWNRITGEIPSSLGGCTSLVSLYMEGNLFHGTIPASLSSLRGLDDLDLSSNNLSGQIPKFLGSLVLLQNLNLSFNKFEGEVPTKGVFKNSSAVSVTGNKMLCGGTPELQLPTCIVKGPSNRRWSLKLKLVISFVSITFGIIGLLFLVKKRREPSSGSSFEGSILKLSYKDLLIATDGFSSANLIGVGTFGSAYKGILNRDKIVIAVKVLNLQHRGALKSFMAECDAMRTIRHKNIVKILTACSSVDFQGNDFKALVYELMVNGSLEEWLHSHPGEYKEHMEPRNLSLLQRLNIAIDVAFALDYLHNHCETPIIHSDLKPTNVLLNGDMTSGWLRSFQMQLVC